MNKLPLALLAALVCACASASSGRLQNEVSRGYGRVLEKSALASMRTMSRAHLAAPPESDVRQILRRLRALDNVPRPGARPLFVVDGVPLSRLPHIHPSDIEDITVLQDAASCAIYGVRGGGVVLIQTRTD